MAVTTTGALSLSITLPANALFFAGMPRTTAGSPAQLPALRLSSRSSSSKCRPSKRSRLTRSSSSSSSNSSSRLSRASCSKSSSSSSSRYRTSGSSSSSRLCRVSSWHSQCRQRQLQRCTGGRTLQRCVPLALTQNAATNAPASQIALHVAELCASGKAVTACSRSALQVHYKCACSGQACCSQTAHLLLPSPAAPSALLPLFNTTPDQLLKDSAVRRCLGCQRTRCRRQPYRKAQAWAARHLPAKAGRPRSPGPVLPQLAAPGESIISSLKNCTESTVSKLCSSCPASLVCVMQSASQQRPGRQCSPGRSATARSPRCNLSQLERASISLTCDLQCVACGTAAGGTDHRCHCPSPESARQLFRPAVQCCTCQGPLCLQKPPQEEQRCRRSSCGGGQGAVGPHQGVRCRQAAAAAHRGQRSEYC